MSDWWCRVMHFAVGEMCYTKAGAYVGILWHCRDCDRKYIRCTWRGSDEYCPEEPK